MPPPTTQPLSRDQETDMVNHPTHYTFSNIEVIDAIEAWKLEYRLGCVVKYVARADHKGSKREDLLKAQWYLNRYIEKEFPEHVAEQAAKVEEKQRFPMQVGGTIGKAAIG